jgi:FkbH-like protein
VIGKEEGETVAKKKVVIWDLDNTIWSGILSEDTNVVLREGIREIIEELDKRGILQSIVSKNNYDDAMNKLKEFNLDYFFIYPMINWNTKSSNVEYIVKSINVAMDTITFIDDQIFERDEVNARFPEVTCLDTSEIDGLLLRDDMNPQFITEDSKNRRILYQNDIKRKEMEEQFEGTQEEFLKSLNMVMECKKAKEDDLQRIEELTIRTHQLNSTGYTYSYDELKSFIEDKNYELSVVDLKDKYGCYGKIGIVLIKKVGNVWTLKLLLTSCRVMNRGVGTALLGMLINRAIDNNVILRAEFVPTDRNRIMALTYAMNGFHIESQDCQKQVLRFMKEEKVVLPRYIKIVAEV